MTEIREITHFHLFCGLGGGAKGFNKGQARVGNMQAKFVCIGGIDNDPAAIRDFDRLSGVRGTVLDMFSLEQYIAFHGKEPPAGWREATPDDIRRAAGGRRPNICFLSAPCKGFSGLLSEKLSLTGKYQALNALTLRGIWLMLEAWKDDPVELLVFENVPRIATRGRALLDQIIALLRAYGYIVAETTHDCGELGGLAQSRKRFLLVGRHVDKVPPFLYEPEKRSLRAVGDILGHMPMPGAAAGGPMHRIPKLQWKTWVRLAFVEAGSDWRSLNKLCVVDGQLADYLITPEMHGGVLGVNHWQEPVGTVAGASRPGNGSFSIADPRLEQSDKWTDGQAFGVRRWDEATGTVTSKNIPGQGPYSVADPRHHGPDMHNNMFRVVKWEHPGQAVTGAHGTGQCVADPRVESSRHGPYGVCDWNQHARTVAGESLPSNGNFALADPRPPHSDTYKSVKYRVTGWKEQSGAVIAASHSGQCAFAVADPRGAGKATDSGAYTIAPWQGPSGTVIGGSKHGAYGVADPRPKCLNEDREAYLTGGHYGVVPWDSPSGAIPAHAKNNNGRWSVADPRVPEPGEQLVCVIRAMDNTWHRPFTTLELAALQSLVDPEEQLELDGLSDSAWRERIGNAVPPEAAAAIAGVMGTTLLLAWSGETFMLSSTPIWVRQVAVGLSVKQLEAMA